MTTSPAANEGPSHSGSSIYIAFVPWVLFSVVAGRDTLKAAAIVALAAALAIGVRSAVAGHPKMLELGAIAAFAGFTVAAFILDAADSDTVVRYARAIAAGLLALIALLSLLRTPFTEQYARERVPREYWSSPRFKAINRDLTRMWALVFALMVPSHIVAGVIDTRRGNTIFNWVVPILLVVWAIKRTERISAEDAP
jgi:hypothetical protein